MRNLLKSTASVGAVLWGLGTAQAADLPVAAPVMPVVAPAFFSWTGFYIGGHVGVAFHDDRDHDLCDAIVSGRDKHGEPFDPECESGGTIVDGPDDGRDVRFIDFDGDYIAVLNGEDDEDDHSFLAGAQAGFNWQTGSFVLGVEADVSFLGFDDDDDHDDVRFQYFHDLDGDELDLFEGEGRIDLGRDVDWLASLRGRAGMALGAEGRFLPYITGGVAFAGLDDGFSATFDSSGGVDLCDGGCFFRDADHDDDDDVEIGLAFGGGVEWAITDRISLGLEYLGYFFDENDKGREITFAGDPEREITFEFDEGVDDIHTVRGKVNFRFGGPAAEPAVAPEVTTRY